MTPGRGQGAGLIGLAAVYFIAKKHRGSWPLQFAGPAVGDGGETNTGVLVELR